MKVTPVYADLDWQKSDLVRSPGVHASNLYGPLYRFLEPKRYGKDGPPNSVLMLLGSAFEDRVEKCLRWNGIDCYRPGEFTSDEGIPYSPDLVMCDGAHPCFAEIKLTSMSLKDFPPVNQISNYFPPKADKHMCQLMLYSHWAGWSNGVYIVCSIREPWNPELRCYGIEWKARELQENHATVMNYAKAARII